MAWNAPSNVNFHLSNDASLPTLNPKPRTLGMLGITDYLWRLIPANPILLRVVEAGGKRRRDLFVRCGYLGLLILVVIFSLVGSTDTLGGGSLGALAKVSARLFQQMSY